MSDKIDPKDILEKAISSTFNCLYCGKHIKTELGKKLHASSCREIKNAKNSKSYKVGQTVSYGKETPKIELIKDGLIVLSNGRITVPSKIKQHEEYIASARCHKPIEVPNTIDAWVKEYIQRCLDRGKKTESSVYTYLKTIFGFSGFVKFRGWQIKDMDAAFKKVAKLYFKRSKNKS